MAKVASSEDQYAVGEFGSDSPDEAFSNGVRWWAAGRDLHGLDADIGEDAVEGCGELACAVADQEPDLGSSFAEVGHEVAGLLRRPGPVGVGGDAEDVDVAGVDLDHEEQVGPQQRDGAVDVEEIAGQHRQLSARRNSRQLVSVALVGAGGMRSCFRMRRIVEAPTRCPSFRSSPWMRW